MIWKSCPYTNFAWEILVSLDKVRQTSKQISKLQPWNKHVKMTSAKKKHWKDYSTGFERCFSLEKLWFEVSCSKIETFCFLINNHHHIHNDIDSTCVKNRGFRVFKYSQYSHQDHSFQMTPLLSFFLKNKGGGHLAFGDISFRNFLINYICPDDLSNVRCNIFRKIFYSYFHENNLQISCKIHTFNIRIFKFWHYNIINLPRASRWIVTIRHDLISNQ